jgi:transposase
MTKGWKATDVRRLQSSVRNAKGKRLYVRLQTLLWLAQGKSVSEAASLMGVSRQVVHLWRQRYWAERTTECLQEGARSGRPRTDTALSDEMIVSALSFDPRTLGYRHNAWTVAVLSDYLNHRHATAVHPATLRRRLKAMGLRYKRPKYVYEDKEPNRAQKKGQSSANSRGALRAPSC